MLKSFLGCTKTKRAPSLVQRLDPLLISLHQTRGCFPREQSRSHPVVHAIHFVVSLWSKSALQLMNVANCCCGCICALHEPPERSAERCFNYCRVSSLGKRMEENNLIIVCVPPKLQLNFAWHHFRFSLTTFLPSHFFSVWRLLHNKNSGPFLSFCTNTCKTNGYSPPHRRPQNVISHWQHERLLSGSLIWIS